EGELLVSWEDDHQTDQCIVVLKGKVSYVTVSAEDQEQLTTYLGPGSVLNEPGVVEKGRFHLSAQEREAERAQKKLRLNSRRTKTVALQCFAPTSLDNEDSAQLSERSHEEEAKIEDAQLHPESSDSMLKPEVEYRPPSKPRTIIDRKPFMSGGAEPLYLETVSSCIVARASHTAIAAHLQQVLSQHTQNALRKTANELEHILTTEEGIAALGLSYLSDDQCAVMKALSEAVCLQPGQDLLSVFRPGVTKSMSQESVKGDIEEMQASNALARLDPIKSIRKRSTYQVRAVEEEESEDHPPELVCKVLRGLVKVTDKDGAILEIKAGGSFKTPSAMTIGGSLDVLTAMRTEAWQPGESLPGLTVVMVMNLQLPEDARARQKEMLEKERKRREGLLQQWTELQTYVRNLRKGLGEIPAFNPRVYWQEALSMAREYLKVQHTNKKLSVTELIMKLNDMHKNRNTTVSRITRRQQADVLANEVEQLREERERLKQLRNERERKVKDMLREWGTWGTLAMDPFLLREVKANQSDLIFSQNRLLELEKMLSEVRIARVKAVETLLHSLEYLWEECPVKDEEEAGHRRKVKDLSKVELPMEPHMSLLEAEVARMREPLRALMDDLIQRTDDMRAAFDSTQGCGALKEEDDLEMQAKWELARHGPPHEDMLRWVKERYMQLRYAVSVVEPLLTYKVLPAWSRVLGFPPPPTLNMLVEPLLTHKVLPVWFRVLGFPPRTLALNMLVEPLLTYKVLPPVWFRVLGLPILTLTLTMLVEPLLTYKEREAQHRERVAWKMCKTRMVEDLDSEKSKAAKLLGESHSKTPRVLSEAQRSASAADVVEDQSAADELSDTAVTAPLARQVAPLWEDNGDDWDSDEEKEEQSVAVEEEVLPRVSGLLDMHEELGANRAVWASYMHRTRAALYSLGAGGSDKEAEEAMAHWARKSTGLNKRVLNRCRRGVEKLEVRVQLDIRRCNQLAVRCRALWTKLGVDLEEQEAKLDAMRTWENGSNPLAPPRTDILFSMMTAQLDLLKQAIAERDVREHRAAIIIQVMYRGALYRMRMGKIAKVRYHLKEMFLKLALVKLRDKDKDDHKHFKYRFHTGTTPEVECDGDPRASEAETMEYMQRKLKLDVECDAFFQSLPRFQELQDMDCAMQMMQCKLRELQFRQLIKCTSRILRFWNKAKMSEDDEEAALERMAAAYGQNGCNVCSGTSLEAPLLVLQ
ncbi:hypothetical protein CYMTET_35857, partial [Cymbomonas tetramitiformis]